jgi:hypothetical protein
MAQVLGTVVLNGLDKKVFQVNYLDNDAAGAGTALAVDFTAAPFSKALVSAPLAANLIHTAAAADAPAAFAITAMSASGCTLRILAAGGGAGGANTIQVTLDICHTIIN